MSLRDFLNVITHRWWVVVVTVQLALVGALAYAHHQQPMYQASATTFAHPSALADQPSDFNSDIGLLTYSTLAQTFASLAESRTLLTEAMTELDATNATRDHYTVTSSTLPETTILQVSVVGPDAVLV